MALTLFEAAITSQNPLLAGILKAFVTEDEMFAMLPFVPKAGDSFMYNREKALPSVEWVAPTHSSLSESTATFEEITVPKREIASNMDILNFAIANQNDGGAGIVANQIMQKAKAAGRELARAFVEGNHVTGYTLYQTAAPFSAITALTAGPHQDSDRQGPGTIEYKHSSTEWRYRAPGDVSFGDWVTASGDGDFTLRSSNPSRYIKVTLDVSLATADGQTQITFTSSNNEPDGLAKQVSEGQTRVSTGTDGDSISFDIMDQLLDMVKVRDGNLAFVMNSKVRRQVKSLMRSLGGSDPADVRLPSFGADGASVERPVLSYDGVPILKNDNIPSDESKGANTDLSSVYLVNMAPDQGVYAGAFGGASFEADLDPMDRVVLGLNIVPVGQLENKNGQRWRLSWYGGFAVGSDLTVARATEIQTS